MNDNKRDEAHDLIYKPVQQLKIVAEMPDDAEMRENINEMRNNDGYPDSCGIHNSSSSKDEDNTPMSDRTPEN